MKIGRRRFIQDTAAAGSIPTLSYLMLPFSSLPARAPLPSGPSAQRLPGGGSAGSERMFKIYGWQRDDFSAFDSPEITSDGAESNAPSNQPISVGVSRSWRATWR
jgi:hypothetical protein